MGDSKIEAVRRGGERVFCKEPDFDDMICMPVEIYDCFYRTYVLKVPCVDKE